MAELAVAGAVLSATGGIAGAFAAEKAGRAQAEEAERQAKLAETAAAETEAEHRRELRRSLGAIDVAFGASTLDPSSPTALALRESTTAEARRNRIVETSNLLNQASQLRRQGQVARMEGRARRNIGLLSAGGKLLSSAQGF